VANRFRSVDLGELIAVAGGDRQIVSAALISAFGCA
jgi:hypothetical protein